MPGNSRWDLIKRLKG